AVPRRGRPSLLRRVRSGAPGARSNLVRPDQLRAGGAAPRPGGAPDTAPEPAAGEQALASAPRRHLWAVCPLVGQLGAPQRRRGSPSAASPAESRVLPAHHRPAAAAL